MLLPGRQWRRGEGRPDPVDTHIFDESLYDRIIPVFVSGLKLAARFVAVNLPPVFRKVLDGVGGPADASVYPYTGGLVEETVQAVAEKAIAAEDNAVIPVSLKTAVRTNG